MVAVNVSACASTLWVEKQQQMNAKKNRLAMPDTVIKYSICVYINFPLSTGIADETYEIVIVFEIYIILGH